MHSVTVVHPPHVALISRVRVKTDNKAALILARLHAVGLLEPVWVPPVEVRELRALIAQRAKMVNLSTQAKNRLHALLHRKGIVQTGSEGSLLSGKPGVVEILATFLTRALPDRSPISTRWISLKKKPTGSRTSWPKSPSKMSGSRCWFICRGSGC